jgi:hypothetical protein
VAGKRPGPGYLQQDAAFGLYTLGAGGFKV